MDQRKCDCGHTNPIGTLLCESCGKPLDPDFDSRSGNAVFPDMRYEGMARRSQTYSATLIDRIWNFFSSVKVAIAIIVVTLIACVIGTIFPQKRYIPVPVPDESAVAAFYETTYGKLGKIYYLLGFHELFSSWWFITLLVMLGASLVICSLDRIIPLYKALSRPRVKQHLSFITGQQIVGETDEGVDVPVQQAMDRAAATLRKKGYRVWREGESLMGEKARFSRWGPYVNHIGLIIFLIGVLMRNIPGFYLDDFVWVREGQTVPVPGTPYYVKNLAYTTEYYKEGEFPAQPGQDVSLVPKSFQTDAVLYVNENAGLPGAPPKLREVLRGPIVVNHPMVYEDLMLYQLDRREMELGALNFELIDRLAGNKPVGRLKLDLYDPPKEVKVAEGITVRVLDYYPDFYLDANGQPATHSTAPNNPMFALEITSPHGGKERLAYAEGAVINQNKNPRFTLKLQMPDFLDISGLNVRKDKAMPVIYAGAFIVMVGLVMGFYWQHRRIWVHAENGRLYLAGHTNKNWFGLRREIEHLARSLALPITLVQKAKADRNVIYQQKFSSSAS